MIVGVREGQVRKTVLCALIPSSVFLAFALILIVFGNISHVSAAEDGKAVFLKGKCNVCHSVSTADISAKVKAGALDLVNVTVRHEKPWIRKYFRAQEEHVSCPEVNSSKDGKTHKEKFKFDGNQKEEDALIDWLDRQRSEE